MDRKPEFYSSTRGARKLCFEGFSYCKDRIDANSGKTYWKCGDRSCKGRMITDSDDRIVKETPHDSHGPDVPAVEIERSMARMKEVARSSRESPANLINRELEIHLPAKFRGYYPDDGAVRKTVQRVRRKHMPELPKSLDEVLIPEALQKNSHREQWLLSDLTGGDGQGRVIVFCTERCLRYLACSKVWYGDGTSSVAPTYFYQLYTIHGVVMDQLLPLAYCLLSRKTRAIYSQMFLVLHDQAVRRGFTVDVQSLRVDFEVAVIKAFSDVFPDADIECCLFHLSQAHWRKIQDLGLRQEYVQDESLAKN